MNYRHTIEYSVYNHINELDDADKKLIDLANDAASNAYAKYSNFKVGATVLLENGDVVKGSNQENIAFPSGLCAERVALFYCGANFPGVRIKTLCIVANGDLIPKEQLLSPCGACRQVMMESQERQGEPYRVILMSQNGKVSIFNSVSDLLPFAFGVF